MIGAEAGWTELDNTGAEAPVSEFEVETQLRAGYTPPAMHMMKFTDRCGCWLLWPTFCAGPVASIAEAASWVVLLSGGA